MTLPAPSIDARALVTGASQGIGMAIARDLAKLGHNLILVARRADILAQLADELERKHSIIAEVYPCDLADTDQLHKLIDDIRDRNINIIINSAGIASFGPFINQDWNYETTQFALNATAVFELTHAVLPGMIRRKTGAICNVGSAAGNIPIPNNATYVLTKAGVSCTLLAPGPVRDAIIPENEKSIVDKVVPDVLWTTYESCAKETLEAMAKNRRRVVPGPLSKAMNVVSSVAPTRVLSPVMGWFYKKMS